MILKILKKFINKKKILNFYFNILIINDIFIF